MVSRDSMYCQGVTRFTTCRFRAIISIYLERLISCIQCRYPHCSALPTVLALGTLAWVRLPCLELQFDNYINKANRSSRLQILLDDGHTESFDYDSIKISSMIIYCIIDVLNLTIRGQFHFFQLELD